MVQKTGRNIRRLIVFILRNIAKKMYQKYNICIVLCIVGGIIWDVYKTKLQLLQGGIPV